MQQQETAHIAWVLDPQLSLLWYVILQQQGDGYNLAATSILGAGSQEEMPTITLFYTYEAVGAGDAILSVECDPLMSKYGIDMKLYNNRRCASVGRTATGTGG